MIILLIGSFCIAVAILLHETHRNFARDIIMVGNIAFGITLVIAGTLEIMGFII